MGRSQNAFNKKAKEKKRLQKRKDKQQRKEERKANFKPGGTLEEMMAYVDENGNIMKSPGDPDKKREEVDPESIDIAIPKKAEENEDASRRGKVTFFDINRGFGFINQNGTDERFFVHARSLTTAIQEGDKVSFKARKGMKGMEATDIKVITT